MAAQVQDNDLLLLDRFMVVAEELKAEPHIARTTTEAIASLRAILSNSGAKRVVISRLPSEVWDGVVKNALDGFVDYDLIENLNKDRALKACANADAGITWAEYAIAREGALMEVTYDDAEKLASSLPLVHIAFVSSKRVLQNIAAGMLKVQGILASSEPGKLPVISFISGPSKTSDIELRLLYGVHGPLKLHVVALLFDFNDDDGDNKTPLRTH